MTASMRDRFVAASTALLDERLDVAVVVADISADRFAAARRRHRDRVVNVGIREQLMISVAGGLALEGLRPIAHSYATFLVERPFEQIKLDLSHQGLGAVLVSIAGSYDASAEGRTHQSPGDVALLDTLADWTVHVPGHPDEAELAVRSAVATTGGAYVRLSEQCNASAHAPSAGPGSFALLRRGAAGVVVAVGPMLDPVLAATEGLEVTVLYASTIRPFDGAGLAEAAASSRSDVVVVEPYLAGTSAGAVATALRDVPHRLLSLGVRDVELRRYGSPAEHARAHGLDCRGLRAAVTGFLKA